MGQCRLPVLFTVINIMIRSGCSFKPKSIPMFINRIQIRPKNAYGSSYNLLNEEEPCDVLQKYYEEEGEISSSSEFESGDESEDSYADENGIPMELFSEI